MIDWKDEEDDELVFENDDLTWGDVARAAGVDEPIYQTRQRTPLNASLRSRGRGRNQIQTGRSAKGKEVLVEEEEELEEDIGAECSEEGDDFMDYDE